ncbi:LAQU0S13e02982g1_1 [Lachancea quebecensis]|uniref:Nuclear mRNA export factor n=1 Tax=Lachancea quebecensis TaxID=1654605 RepID=A0A0P1L1S5_9SACH|nr:LAQU0S13e02982g1_1 [Lachancea quebecensis]
MSSAVRASAPSSGFSFFNNSRSNGSHKGFAKKGHPQKRDKTRKANRPGKQLPRENLTQSAKPNKNTSNIKDDGAVVPLVNEPLWTSPSKVSAVGPYSQIPPEQLGFQRIAHKPRNAPRYLIQQRPRLKPGVFTPDPWDVANQQKMLTIENEISDPTQLWETLKKMRETERRVMEDKRLVDRADSAKDLNDAIVFEGSCQDMCPVFERARRSVENNVVRYEKEDQNSKRISRFKALKVFARPAAAAAPSLPSDVRPPAVLVKTLDYIVNNIVPHLPQCEGFLWDRMRSIRQDFTYQNYSGPEAVDCNERIVRIHLLILHVMAKSNVEYSMQQELEQLHKALITLSEIYDEVRSSGGQSPNEAEFRAYSLLSRPRDPEYDKMAQSLPQDIFNDDMVQLALCFRRIVSNSGYSERGHMKTENGLNLYNRFFQLIKSDHVPFMMCSFLEVYVNEIRFYALKSLSHSINRKHKPMPIDYLKEELMFNDESEVFAFCKHYSIEVGPEGVKVSTLSHHSHNIAETRPLKQSYLSCVEEKLQNTPACDLINVGKPNFDTLPQAQAPYNHSQGDATSPSISHMTENMPESLGGTHTMQPSAPFSNGEVNTGFGTSIKLETLENGNNIAHSVEAKEQIEKEKRDEIQRQKQSMIQQKVEEQRRLKEEREREKQYEIQQEQKRQQEEANRLANDDKKAQERASELVANSLIQDVVRKHLLTYTEECLAQSKANRRRIEVLADELYRAFLHEKLYFISLETKADLHLQASTLKLAWNAWNKKLTIRRQKQEHQKRTLDELTQVGKRLGIPEFKRPRTETPLSSFSFTLPSSSRNNLVHTPINNQESQFKTPVHKNTAIWKPVDLKTLYCNPIAEQIEESSKASRQTLEEKSKISIFVFSRSWDSVSSRWLSSKFGIPSNPKQNYTSDDGRVKLEVNSARPDFSTKQLENLQLLVFNSGVTENNIFDLELKLKQDGEKLIELTHGIALNTSYKFSILIVYWESAENPLPNDEISKYLKLNKISKIFAATLDTVEVVKLTGDAPHKVLESSLSKVAHLATLELTERGAYNRSLRLKSPSTSVVQTSAYRSSREIDEKLRSALEQERRKHEQERNRNNTYAYLQSHIAASPRARTRKLPVLLSESHGNRFKTPLAVRPFVKRTPSYSVPSVPSHLAAKVRLARETGPAPAAALPLPADATPSYSRNQEDIATTATTAAVMPATPLMESSARCYPGAANTSGISNVTFESPFSTPAARLLPSVASPAVSAGDASSSVVELRDLIASVKKKLNKQ